VTLALNPTTAHWLIDTARQQTWQVRLWACPVIDPSRRVPITGLSADAERVSKEERSARRFWCRDSAADALNCGVADAQGPTPGARWRDYNGRAMRRYRFAPF